MSKLALMRIIAILSLLVWWVYSPVTFIIVMLWVLAPCMLVVVARAIGALIMWALHTYMGGGTNDR